MPTCTFERVSPLEGHNIVKAARPRIMVTAGLLVTAARTVTCDGGSYADRAVPLKVYDLLNHSLPALATATLRLLSQMMTSAATPDFVVEDAGIVTGDGTVYVFRFFSASDHTLKCRIVTRPDAALAVILPVCRCETSHASATASGTLT